MGFSVIQYSRSTYDIDIFFEPTTANIKRIVQALTAAGYDGIEDLTEKQLRTKKTLLRQFVLDTDIHPFVKGAEFKDVWKDKKETTIEKVKVYVPSLDHIIMMKKAAGRNKDLADLEVLEKIREKLR
jgi:hypothetical protein